MKATGIILLLLVWHASFSQWHDDFLDGDYSLNPSWKGDTASFIVENNILRLFAPAAGSSSYLATTSESINDASWQFSVRFDFNPSSSNYAKIYLVASLNNLKASLEGYFVKIGNTADEISLYRQDGMVAVEIIDGLDGRVGLSVVNVTILVTRDRNGEWQLSSKLPTETNWYLEGSTLDNTYLASSWFGVNCTYTATRSTKFYFDDFIVSGTPYVDTDPPLIDTVYTISNRQLIIKINEAIDSTSADALQNYMLNQQFTPATVLVADSAINLTFTNPVPVINQLAISNVEDLHGNIIRDTLVQVIYVDDAPVIYGDIVINEIMADPSPREDLPETEYIELFNASGKAIDMTGWSYQDKVSVAKIPPIVILPDSFLIFTNDVDESLFSVYGRTIGLSPWPSLNNFGDSLTLTSSIGDLIDVVEYTKSWYNNAAKAEGGWSLERINPDQPCSGYLNWSAANDSRGGTPGKANSVVSFIDNESPKILHYTINQNMIDIEFNEPIRNNLYSIITSPGNQVTSYAINYNILNIYFAQPFASGINNKVTITSISDCFGNRADTLSIAFVPDFISPQIDTVFTNYPNRIEVYFTEPIKAPITTDIKFNDDLLPTEVRIDADSLRHITLATDSGFIINQSYLLTIDNVTDLFGNTASQLIYSFIYAPLRHPRYGEVLITELMVDPEPPVNLPAYEYIELTNKTNERLLLEGLILADARDEVFIPAEIIEPGKRVVLTKTSATDDFKEYGKTIGIPNWPTLNNTGDVVTILDSEHKVINSVAYENSWYKDEEKSAGGWALELLDEVNYCQGERVWAASKNILGGTPGEVNSYFTTVPDLLTPQIIEAFAFAQDSILIRFNKPLASAMPEFAIEGSTIIKAGFNNYSHDECFLYVEPLNPKTKYVVTASRITDCAGNLNTEDEAIVFLPEIPETGEVVISEVLFNPVTDGVDFIEVNNNSAKYFSPSNWQLSNGSSVKTVFSRKILPPYSFRVFTTSPENILNNYPKAIEENIFVQEIPAMSNDKGNITIYSRQGVLLDSIHYEEAWHFPYLERVDGVSLERISMKSSGTISTNWASAASLDNYATPGYSNSQAATSDNNQPIAVEPRVIVPDGDGRDDFTTISLEQGVSVSQLTVSIYNLNGQPVRELANNILVGNNVSLIWDGTDSHGAIVPLGHYIIVIRVITGDGSTYTYRDKVVVAAGF